MDLGNDLFKKIFVAYKRRDRDTSSDGDFPWEAGLGGRGRTSGKSLYGGFFGRTGRKGRRV